MERFAKAILEAQRIREESFDNEAADKAREKSKDPRNKTSDEIFIDFSKFYKKSMHEAANEAARNAGYDKRGTLPIYLLNQYCWNDIQAWAENK